jgi:VanZ family protein
VRNEATAPEPVPAASPSKPRGALWYWAPLAVWLAAIFCFSTDAMSAAHTSRFVEPIVRAMLPGASYETIYGVHVAVRKCGHLAEYALLGLLAFRAVRSGRAEPFRPRWAVAALAIAAVYALVDEYHQTFVSSRTGNLGDAAIDVVGAGAALVALAWARLRANRADRRDV